MSREIDQAAPTSWPPARDRVLLANGRVADVRAGQYHPPGTGILVHEGRILALTGRPEAPGAPPPDVVVDLGGRAVIPGLINTHVHLQMIVPSTVPVASDLVRVHLHRQRQIAHSLAACLAAGVTHVRDTWTLDLRRNRELVGRIAAGDLPGPRIHQAVVVGPLGGYLSEPPDLAFQLTYAAMGTPAMDHDDPHCGVVSFPPDASTAVVRDAVTRAVEERGAECLKLADQRESLVDLAPTLRIITDAQMAAVVDRAAALGRSTTLHCNHAASFRRAVRLGIGSCAHFPMDGPLPDPDLAAFVASGCVLEPTVSTVYAFVYPVPGFTAGDHPALARLIAHREATYRSLANTRWIPALAPAVRRGVERLARGDRRLLGVVDRSAVFRFAAPSLTEGIANVRRLRAAGACLAAGNDAGMPPFTAADVGFELALLDFFLREGAGAEPLTGAEALRLATLNGARSLGIEADHGSLEPGKVADLAIVDGDPLRDPAVIGRPVAALLLDGRLRVDRIGLGRRVRSGRAG